MKSVTKKPKLFIGSSSEALDIARNIQELLRDEAEANVWKEGAFRLSETSIESLVSSLEMYDFAIFVFNPDDISTIRGEEWSAVRDNVIFEFGLFIGSLGRNRVFCLIPEKTEKIRLPSDLAGITSGTYDINIENLLSALGPFCNQVRRQIKECGFKKASINPQDNADTESSLTVNNTQATRKTENLDTIINYIDEGIGTNAHGDTIITKQPTVFFDDCICSAFPGIRGLKWFDRPEEAVVRLENLFNNPIIFDKALGHGVSKIPLACFRGNQKDIRTFKKLTNSRCLINSEELEISKLCVFRSDSYWKSYIYIEVKADKPVGIYNHSDVDIKKMVDSLGYADEEYGLYQNIPITRECYDDGAAEINGVITDTRGSALRRRYLSQYNFILSSRFSPINSRNFDSISKPILDDILKGKNRFDELHDNITKLRRNELDD